MIITEISNLPACKIINNGVVLAIVPDSTKEPIQLEKPIVLTKGSISFEFFPIPESKPLIIKLHGKPSKKVSKFLKKEFAFLSI